MDDNDLADNLLLNLNDDRSKGRFASIFSRKQNAYDDVMKSFTKNLISNTDLVGKDLAKSKSHNPKGRNRRSEEYSGGSSDEEDSEGDEGDSEEVDSEDEKETESGGKHNLDMNKNKSLNIISDKKLDNKLTHNLMQETDDPLESIDALCESMLEVSRYVDLEVQKKISREINAGKVNANAKKHLRDQKIKKQTKDRASPEKIYHDNNQNNEEEDDLPEDREFIDFGHEKFDLVFNIMLGIKRSIDCIFQSPFSKIRDSDYKANFEYKNEWYSSSETASNVFYFYDYAPKIFEDIRSKDGITNDEYIDALGPNNIYNYIWTNDFKSFTSLVSSGKSGALFYYSMDGKFMLKTIAKDEFYKLLDTLQPFHEHLLAHPDSLMTRYYGLHKIRYKENGKSREQYIIIMNNMFRKFVPDIKYDLKGSTQGRSTEFKDGKRDSKIALKDNDFTEENRHVDMSDDDKKALMNIIRHDCGYLGQNTTLDYSLLLGIIDLDKIREEFKKDPKSFHEKDPVLQVLKEGKSSISERGIYLAENQKEVKKTKYI